MKLIGKTAPIQSTVPLSSVVSGLLILKMFLDNMIATSIFLLFMLAVLLIYSLMISDVEEKTYEFGMLRALGFKKTSLIYLLIAEGIIFAIPGLALGLLMAYLINSVIAYFIFNQSMVVTSYELHWSAIVLAFGLGIFIPLISVYLPIQRAMSKTLRDSLDLYHRVVNEISVSVQKLEKLGISFSQSFNALTLILMGVVCYYFAPAAFVYQDIALFLAIINIVLILMIIGFTLLLNLAQPLVERLFIKLFLCFFRGQKHLEPIIVKNMDGHRRRNGKTALMYTVALSFLIFAGTGFKLQSKSIVDNLKSQLGSDIKILLLNDKTGLDEYGMRQFLSNYVKENPDHIREYSFITMAIDQFPQISKPKFSSLSQFPTNRNLQLRGIEKNYLRSAYLDFYYPVDFDPKMSFPKVQGDPDDNKDAVYGLYSDEGLQKLENSIDYFKVASNSDIRDQSQMGGGVDVPDDNTDNQNDDSASNNNNNQTSSQVSRNKYEDKEIKLIIPSGLHYISSIDVNTPCFLNFDDIKYRARIRNTSKKFPGFRFSSYRQISFFGEILTSTEQFKYLLDSYYYYNGLTEDEEIKEFFSKVQPNSSFNLPKNSLNVQFSKSLSRSEREAIGNGLRNYFKSDFTQLFDVPSIIQQIEDTLFFIDLFSLVVAVISIILSFFLILVSFVANIKENSWEFGVLRAIGLSKMQITRVYMMESCALVLASGTIGTIIGLVVAITLTLQLLMFTELPFSFVFPFEMFFTTFFFGLFIAATASYTALSEFKDKPISTIVKGLI